MPCLTFDIPRGDILWGAAVDQHGDIYRHRFGMSVPSKYSPLKTTVFERKPSEFDCRSLMQPMQNDFATYYEKHLIFSAV